MKILMTGASGYIGSRLMERLAESEHEAKPLPLFRKESHTILQYKADDWAKLIGKYDVVIYLAAQTDAVEANKEPRWDLRCNVSPFLEMLEGIRIAKAHTKVIFASTATVVGWTNADTRTHIGKQESPITIYDVHKLTCEHYLYCLTALGELEGVSLRLTNVYGPSSQNSGSKNRGFINRAVQASLKGENLYTFLGLIRDFVYIGDVCEAILLACEWGRMNGEPFLVGSGLGYDFTEVCQLIAELAKDYGHNIQVESRSADELDPINRRSFVADNRQFKQISGWQPKIGLEEGLRKTMEYYANQS